MTRMKISFMGVAAVFAAATAAADPMTVERRAGTDWRDGLFLGDGQTGVLAYAPLHLEWLVNRNDVIDGRIRLDHRITHAEVMKRMEDPKQRNAQFLEEADGCRWRHEHRDTISAAIVRLRFWDGLGWAAPAAPEVTQNLSLRSGELKETAVAGYLDAAVDTCVVRQDDVVSFKVSRGDGAILELVRPDNPLLGAPDWSTAEGVLSFVQKLPDGNRYAVALALTSRKPAFAAAGLAASAKDVGPDFEAFLAVRTTRDGEDPGGLARAAVLSARAAGYAKAAATSAAWWTDFWEKGGDVSFTSEPEVDAAWHFSLYALASSYGRPPMPGLNGLTYGPIDSTVAGLSYSDYTHDQNVQIPMFAFYPVNHCAFVRSFASTYERMRAVLEENTRALYGTRGIGLPLAINQDGYENPTGAYRYTLCGAAYSALVLAQAWRYSRDRAILADVYPLLRDFVEFYVSLMHKDSSGIYRLDWMVPPEIFSMTRDEIASIACLKTSLATLLEASELLGRDADRREAWRDVLAHYPPFVKHSSGGWWCGPDIPDDHYMYGGHLFYPFYPSEAAIDADARATTLRTIDYLKTYAVDWSWFSAEPHPCHDWTAYYHSVATLRLGAREQGWKAVVDYLRLFRKPNGLFSHNPILVEDLAAARKGLAKAPKPVRRSWNGRTFTVSGYSRDVTANPDAKRLVPPVIEGLGAFVFIATESLLQSWGGEIRLFPCVPANFTGSFRNLLAQGGIRVSAEMKDGKLVSKEIVRP